MPSIPIPPLSWPLPGRVVVAVLAFVPIVIVTVCTVPAWVLAPFVPFVRAEADSRLRTLVEWTGTILTLVLTAPGGTPDEADRAGSGRSATPR